jgi:enoyl-CoA hydratase
MIGGIWMPYQTLIFHREDHVATIDFHEPVQDRSGLEMLIDELSEVFDEIKSDNELRVVVIAGAIQDFKLTEGRPFMNFFKDEGESTKKALSVAGPIADLDRPVIMGIEGDVIAVGLELALASDIRIAAATAHFGLPHIKEGLIPWDGGTQRLSRVVGKAKAMEMILTGELIDAQEAHRIGLVSKVVPSEEVMTVTMDMAREMASKGPMALRYAKEAIHKGMNLTLEQGLRLEADLYFLLHTTKDRTEGIKAFREKRTPEFEGK